MYDSSFYLMVKDNDVDVDAEEDKYFNTFGQFVVEINYLSEFNLDLFYFLKILIGILHDIY